VNARARRRRQAAQDAVEGTSGAVITGEDGTFGDASD
jgi:hypothetical protein